MGNPVIIPDWQSQAVCAEMDPNLFFPSTISEARVGLKICETCPVKPECDALRETEKHDHGIWGGKWLTPTKKLTLADLDQPTNFTGGKAKLTYQQVVELHAQGLTYQQIAEHLNVSDTTVARTMKRTPR